MPSAKQKAAQNRLASAAKQAKREGKKGKAFATRVGQILRGSKGGGGGAAKRSSASRASRPSGGGGFGHRARGFIDSMTPKKGAQALVILDALSEASANAQRTVGQSAEARAIAVLAPLGDGVLAAKGIGRAVEHGMSGLAQDLANWRFGGKLPKVTLARVVNSGPQFITTPLAFRSYRELRQIGGASTNENLFPRTAAMTGIRVRNVRALGSGDPRWIVGVRDANKPLVDAVLGSPVAPLAAGKIGSGLIQRAHVF